MNANNNLIDDNTTSYFADWAVDKDVDIGQLDDNFSTNVHNNLIDSNIEASSPIDKDENVTLIVSGFPTTEITKIQSIVYYNRQDDFNLHRTLGLALELYSRENDVNLENPLASSNEICRNMPQHASLSWICMNMPQHASLSWICRKLVGTCPSMPATAGFV